MALRHIAAAAETPLATPGRTPVRTAELPPRTPALAEDPAWPTAAEVWNWAEGAVLLGVGPAAARFL